MSRIVYSFRPLPVWPHAATPAERRRSSWTFKASWNETLELLWSEVGKLGDGKADQHVLIGIGLNPGDIRKDGLPRADARAPLHPGVEVSFDSRHGRLTYATDVCATWQHNVRSIALGLEALRAVDRYGVTRRGEQYAGWAQLAAGGPDPARGKALVEQAGGIVAALKKHHPDRGGAQRDMVDVLAYKAEVGG